MAPAQDGVANEFVQVDEDILRCREERAQADIQLIQGAKVDVQLKMKACNYEQDMREIKAAIKNAYFEIGSPPPVSSIEICVHPNHLRISQESTATRTKMASTNIRLLPSLARRARSKTTSGRSLGFAPVP